MMDSLSITREMLKQLIHEAESKGATRIKRIVLEVGEMSGLDSGELQRNFHLLSRDTLAEGATLSITEIPLNVRCLSCSAEYTASGYQLRCTACGSLASEMLSGNELRVKEMEVS